jgi:CheY-like chemotaxis protein
MQLEKLEDLNKYITILIVDDNSGDRESLQLALEQEYETVWAVEKAEEASKYLSKTNILLADYNLATSKINGIELIGDVKKEHGDRIEAILFTAENERKLKQKAMEAKATAYFEKPVQPEYLKLWINELGKRIWLQQILDNNPDEVVIMDQDGTILFIDKEKEKIFGKKLVGDKCHGKSQLRLVVFPEYLIMEP